ncbi:MAG: hypothetical protein JO166_22700, partial [Deltaproteobacteria bacterium]|nr:hypothetical protein [Deltaproteobacteria bacterium]
MNRAARNRDMTLGSKIIRRLLLVVVISAPYLVADARAEDIGLGSAQVADQSFALLDRLSKQPGDKPNPLVGPVASFAGDADSLRQSLAWRDLRSARSIMASLQADSIAIDRALVQHPNAIPAQDWRALREQSEKLAREMPACRVGCAPAISGTGSETTATTADGDSPRIAITSRESSGGIIRVRGYFEGWAIRSAGIYVGSSRLKALKVDHAPGRERVEFDLRLEDSSPATVLRVVDSDGRSTEASLLDPGLASSPPTAETPADSVAPLAPADSDAPGPAPGEDTGTVEIPSHGPLLPSPSKRHTLGSRLGDVTISVLRVTRIANQPPTYAIFGQIVGDGITRAGVYLKGRLIKRIPIVKGSKLTSFDQQIIARAGPTTIRAYSVGNSFVEQPVDLYDAADAADIADYPDDATAMATPMTAARIAVQITSIRALAAGTYLVNGIISGNNVASAGLYQNGVLAQNINLSPGIAGALTSLIPGASRSINFSVRFNPYAGPAVIRAFDGTGAYSEQPLIVAGISPYAPVWPN